MREAVRAELGVKEGQVVVGAVGRLVWEKGYAELFAAARRLLERHPDLVVVVAGPFDADKGDPLIRGRRGRGQGGRGALPGSS